MCFYLFKRPAAFVFSFIIVIFFFSCKKTSLLLEDVSNKTGNSKDFFSYNVQDADPLVMKVLTEVKRRNEQSAFIEQFAKSNGYAIWNKSIIKKGVKNRRKTNSFQSSGGEDTMIYIPLVMEDSLSVTGFIIATINDSIGLSFNRASYYQFLSFTDTENEMNASQYAGFMLMLDRCVFGHDKYIVTDPRLFKSNSDNGMGNKLLIWKNNIGSGGNYLVGDDVCEEWEIWYNPDGDACNCSGDEYLTGETYTTGDCSTGGVTWWWPISGGGTAPGGGTPGTGGGGGGGDIPPTYPCNPNLPLSFSGSSPTNNVDPNPLPPCPPEGGGWTPAPNPCDTYMQALPNDAYFTSIFKYLNNPTVINLDVETGFLVIRSAVPYQQVTGVDINSPTINWTNLAAGGIKYDGFLHSHYCPDPPTKCLSGIFSPLDVIFMTQLYLAGKAKDSTNFFIGVASRDNPYILKVTNTTKFRRFAEKISASSKAVKDFQADYNPKLISANPDNNEENFLKMMQEMNAGTGLTLFRGNKDCNQWTKLSLSGTGGVVDEPCF